MSESRGLGRGLSALIGETAAAPAPVERESRRDGLRKVPVGDLRPGPYQPRTRFDEDEIDRLAESLRRSGMMQPIVARPAAGEGAMLEIVAGERRWRAAQKARMHEVPVIVRELDDREVLELGLVENLQRQDLGPLEEAAGYDRLRREFELTQAEIAHLVGKSRAQVANMMRLLGLPQPVLALLDNGTLSAGHGRALLAANKPEALARNVVDRGLSVRQTEQLVAAEGTGGSTRRPTKVQDDPVSADLRDLQNRLSEHTGLKVEIKSRGERGQLVLTYASLDQLEDMIARLEAPQRPRLVKS